MELLTPPKHVAIIPDGNRRWARAHALEALLGHQTGADNFWTTGDALFESGVTHATFWAASVENLSKRTPHEVSFLVNLAKQHLANPKVLAHLIELRARLRVIGAWRELLQDEELAQAVDSIEQQTAHFNECAFTLLFGYSGTIEMLDAIKTLSGNDVTSESLRAQLATGFLPDVDLVIRTGGEPHWSAGFMMWLTANSQFYFTKTLWPDFDRTELTLALADFAERQRRFGK